MYLEMHLEMHLETVLELARRCTWKLSSGSLGDAPGNAVGEGRFELAGGGAREQAGEYRSELKGAGLRW